MIQLRVSMHMRFRRRPAVSFEQWSYRDDAGNWHVVKRSATSTAVYDVTDHDEGGLKWLLANEQARASDPLV
jgi:hypothetical protein